MRRHGVWILWLACGCAQQKECKETSAALNAAVARIEALRVSEGDPAAMRNNLDALGRAAGEEAERVGRLSITSQELAKHVADYQRMLQEVARVSGELRAALDASAALEQNAKKSEKDVQAAIEALQRECERGAGGCHALAKKIMQGPTGNEDDAALLRALRRLERDLATLAPEDARVAAALVQLVAAIGGQAGLLEKALAANKQIDAAVKAMDEAVEPEDRIVAAINARCRP